MKNQVVKIAVLFCLFSTFSLSYAIAQNLTGTILETMNAAGYTYVQLEQPGGPVWLAIPETVVNKGDTASFQSGMVMMDFKSKAMDRVFDSIIFSPGLVTSKAATMSPHGSSKKVEQPDNSSFQQALAAEQGNKNTSAMVVEPHQQSAGSTGAVVPSAGVLVEKAAGENSYTIGECFTKAEELNSKSIVVRGRVMKVSTMIMGRNWVHIQDGTGNPMENTHDLVVTTQELPEADTVVIFKGTLHANRDFGAGYKYAAIIEDAKIIN